MKLIRTLWQRWLRLRNGGPWTETASHGQRFTDRLILAALVFVASWIACEYMLTEPKRAFNPYSIGYIAGHVLAIVTGCYAAVRIANRTSTYARFTAAILVWLAIIFAAVTVLDGIRNLSGYTPNFVSVGMDYGADYIVGIAAILLFAVAAYVVAKRTLQIGRVAPVFIAALPLAGMALYTQAPRIPIWYTVSERTAQADGDTAERISVEWTYYDQHTLMSRSLDGLEKQRPGVTDLYFIGFAGYAPQDVFLKEVNAAQRLFDARFDTAGRSMLLINNRATIKEKPLANGHNLWHALSALGEQIDREEDIVFLFLTSHGAQDLLAVNFWPLQPDDLTPADLRDMFDKSGIKWRVIVVSACYSGSFIDELRDDNTLIVTAASADKTSFGCSNEAEFTYFGRAYFDQALRETFSFVDGFADAARIISEREAAAFLTPSEPQIFIGSAIGPKLSALQERLSARFKDQVAKRGPNANRDQKPSGPVAK